MVRTKSRDVRLESEHMIIGTRPSDSFFHFCHFGGCVVGGWWAAALPGPSFCFCDKPLTKECVLPYSFLHATGHQECLKMMKNEEQGAAGKWLKAVLGKAVALMGDGYDVNVKCVNVYPPGGGKRE